jgi:hypothetical protein
VQWVQRFRIQKDAGSNLGSGSDPGVSWLFSFLPRKYSTYFRIHYSPNIPSFESTGHTQNNGEVSEVDKEFISHPTQAQHKLSAAETVQVSHALPAVRLLCLLRGRGTAGAGFLCAPF